MKYTYLLSSILFGIFVFGQNIPNVSYYSDFMYFTESEYGGGGPYSDGQVFFYSTNYLEGILYSQSDISFVSCPTLGQSSYMYTSGVFNFDCGTNFISGIDSIQIPQIELLYPILDNFSNYVYSADTKIGRPGIRDTLIMTEIKFEPGGFWVKQWDYLIPPVTIDDTLFHEYIFDQDTTLQEIETGHIGFNRKFYNNEGYQNVTQIIINQNSPNELSNFELNISDTISLKNDTVELRFIIDAVLFLNVGESEFCILNVSYIGQIGQSTFIAGDSIKFGKIPPLFVNNIPFNEAKYYHNHRMDDGSRCSRDGFHHFQFVKPDNITSFYIINTFVNSEESIIHIKNGPVIVSGIITGQHAIITDLPILYKRYNTDIYDSLFTNIWITSDLIYADSDPETGMVSDTTENKLLLISGSNVIIGNTLENGAGNSVEGASININSVIIALNESFVVQYWQNTTSIYSQPNLTDPSLSFGDGQGIIRFGINSGNQDYRGSINLWGSIFQRKRGHVRRHSPDPYDIPVPGIGYNKNYHYDQNYFQNIPQQFEPFLAIPTGPLAYFGVDTTTGELPLTIHFEDQSTPFSSLYPIIDWYWDFGDGQDSTGIQSPFHTYRSTGVYTVKLTVTDILGLSNSYIIEDLIIVNPTVNILLDDQLINDYSLLLYPNPFNPTTTIAYILPHETEVTLSVYDMQGREMAVLVNATQRSGNHETLWNGKDRFGNDVPTGMYFARLTAEGFSKTIKMVLLK